MLSLTPKLRFTFIVIPMVVVFSALTAFGAGQEEVIEPDVVSKQESPMLAALVEAGELPPVEERLPENPKVVEPWEEIGRYGGEGRSALIGPGDGAWLTRMGIQYDGLVVWDFEWSRAIPAAAASFEANEDVTQWTFELRKGLRWSDGEPVTTADVKWWHEYVLLDDALTPSPPAMFFAGGEPVDVEIIDETTFKFVFAAPNSMLVDGMAAAGNWFFPPSHYAKQFHPEFNEDIHDIAADEGFDKWEDYFDWMIYDGAVWNPDLPSIHAYVPVGGAGYTGEHSEVRFERNPYYYRVDTEGNQLPYIDRWTFDMLEDTEVLLLRTMAGDIDVMVRHINTAENRPVLYDNQDVGDFRLIDKVSGNTNEAGINFNLTHRDDVFRETVRNLDFRKGLSLAIDREEINDLVFAGMGQPRQVAPAEAAPWYSEEWEKAYTEYDPDLANEYFDRAGFEVDERGRRLGPHGEPIVLPIDINAADDVAIAVMELVGTYWADVGVEVELNVVDRALKRERMARNELYGIARGRGHALREPLYDAGILFAYGEASVSPRWAAWYGQEHGAERGLFLIAQGVEPEEPPEHQIRRMELYDQLPVSPPEQHTRIMKEIVAIAGEQLEWIGTVGQVPAYGIYHNRIGNAPPEGQPYSWQYPTPAPADLSQLFIRE